MVIMILEKRPEMDPSVVENGHKIELNLTFSTNGTTFVRGQILFVYWTAWIVTAKLIACNGSIVAQTDCTFINFENVTVVFGDTVMDTSTVL